MNSTDTLLVVSSQLPSILRGIMIVWYVIGLALVGGGIWRLASAGMSRGAASHPPRVGIAMAICGSLMLNLIGTVAAGTVTLFGPGVSPEYVLSTVSTGGDTMQTWITVLLNIVVVIGWYFAGRGLYALATAHNRQEGGWGAGAARFVAGVLLCNAHVFAYAIGASLGATATVSLLIPSPP